MGETGANLLVLGHLVQHDLGHGLLLHLHGDAGRGVVVLHVQQLCLVGRHPHHPLAPADRGGGGGGGRIKKYQEDEEEGSEENEE